MVDLGQKKVELSAFFYALKSRDIGSVLYTVLLNYLFTPSIKQTSLFQRPSIPHGNV